MGAMDVIKLGKITAPQGIKGEVRVLPYTDVPERFMQIDRVLLCGRERRIEKVRVNGKMLVVKLEGAEDRNAAEALRNAELFLSRDDMWEQPEGSYFIDELVGMSVLDEDGKLIGKLAKVHSRPAQDLYEIEKPDGGSFLLPAVKEFVLVVDTEKSAMTVRLIEGLA